MAAENLTGEKIATWRVIHTTVEAELGGQPHLAERHGRLGRLIVEGEDLQVRQKVLLSELRSLNRKRREVALEGEELRSRLAAALQFEHGFRNEKLISYGVKPRQARRRSRNTGEPQPESPEKRQQSGTK
jgi:hypothetical protein